MLIKKLILFTIVFLLIKNGFAQIPCTALGQNPATAFPVCGTDTFSIMDVPICGDKAVPGPCAGLTDKNPFWYKFTCYTPGTLGFLITPATLSDDYDWQIFDITNRNPEDVFTDKSLFVACNWSGEGGLTGASNAGTSVVRCDGLGVPLFSSMPSLELGHEYILLVSHFSNSQSGYTLSFGGGTAIITDPVNPALLKARAACDGSKISIKLNKKMKCSSLAADGSDFKLTPAIAPITSATGIGCATGFDMDSVVLSLGSIVPAGNYTIAIQNGTDGNNLLDNCGRSIPASQSLPVTVFPLTPTPMDSLSKTGCAPIELQLVFKDPIQCNSIATDGSDFIVIGTGLVTVASAAGVCNADGLTNVIKVGLSAPIQKAGTFQIKLQKGTDGNTVINECGVPTAAVSSLSFSTADTVSAHFTTRVHFGCVTDTIEYHHDGLNDISKWQWLFDSNIRSTVKDTTLYWRSQGVKQATLIVGNGVCSDTVSSTTLLNNRVKAAFENTANACPGDPVVFKDISTGPVVLWLWDFGNGNTSSIQLPAEQFYLPSNAPRNIATKLTVANSIGCSDTITHFINVLSNCYIAIPKGFSPNNDGLNDFLYPTNAYKAINLHFRIFNRLGQLIFETRDWTNKWDGSFKGNPQDAGTYVWILGYTNIDNGKRIELKGSTVLIR